MCRHEPGPGTRILGHKSIGTSPKYKTHIAHQREIIQELLQNGHDTALAVSMLHALRGSLHGFEHHRALIIERLTDMG